MLYWNTLLAFPFYTAVGKFADRNLLMIDSSTKKPISIRNDNGMEDIGVYAFDKEDGVQLWVEPAPAEKSDPRPALMLMFM